MPTPGQKALSRVSQTCRVLHSIATPLLYSRYEALFQDPTTGFIDTFVSRPDLQKELMYIIILDGDVKKYTPAAGRLSRLNHQWEDEVDPRDRHHARSHCNKEDEPSELEFWRLVSKALNLEVLIVREETTAPLLLYPLISAGRAFQREPVNPRYTRLHILEL